LNFSGVEEDLKALEAEAIGWLPLREGAYLHVSDPNAVTITLVGVAQIPIEGENILLLHR
jgi:hypothetical protein